MLPITDWIRSNVSEALPPWEYTFHHPSRKRFGKGAMKRQPHSLYPNAANPLRTSSSFRIEQSLQPIGPPG